MPFLLDTTREDEPHVSLLPFGLSVHEDSYQGEVTTFRTSPNRLTLKLRKPNTAFGINTTFTRSEDGQVLLNTVVNFANFSGGCGHLLGILKTKSSTKPRTPSIIRISSKW
jgi:hypothetical protein